MTITSTFWEDMQLLVLAFGSGIIGATGLAALAGVMGLIGRLASLIF